MKWCACHHFISVCMCYVRYIIPHCKYFKKMRRVHETNVILDYQCNDLICVQDQSIGVGGARKGPSQLHPITQPLVPDRRPHLAGYCSLKISSFILINWTDWTLAASAVSALRSWPPPQRSLWSADQCHLVALYGCAASVLLWQL